MSKRILMIEDQEDNRRILRDLLVTNLAARLGGEAKPGQVLISERLLGTVGELTLKGFSRSITAHNVLRLKG